MTTTPARRITDPDPIVNLSNTIRRINREHPGAAARSGWVAFARGPQSETLDEALARIERGEQPFVSGDNFVS